MAAAIHLERNPRGPAGESNPMNHFNLGTGPDTRSPQLNFETTGVPANADTLFLGFELAAGAFTGTSGGFAVGHTTPSTPMWVIPEPGMRASLRGFAGPGRVLRRRRFQKTSSLNLAVTLKKSESRDESDFLRPKDIHGFW